MFRIHPFMKLDHQGVLVSNIPSAVTHVFAEENPVAFSVTGHLLADGNNLPYVLVSVTAGEPAPAVSMLDEKRMAFRAVRDACVFCFDQGLCWLQRGRLAQFNDGQSSFGSEFKTCGSHSILLSLAVLLQRSDWDHMDGGGARTQRSHEMKKEDPTLSINPHGQDGKEQQN